MLRFGVGNSNALSPSFSLAYSPRSQLFWLVISVNHFLIFDYCVLIIWLPCQLFVPLLWYARVASSVLQGLSTWLSLKSKRPTTITPCLILVNLPPVDLPKGLADMLLLYCVSYDSFITWFSNRLSALLRRTSNVESARSNRSASCTRPIFLGTS